MGNKRNPMVAYKAHGAGYALFYLGAGAPMTCALRISEPLALEAAARLASRPTYRLRRLPVRSGQNSLVWARDWLDREGVATVKTEGKSPNPLPRCYLDGTARDGDLQKTAILLVSRPGLEPGTL
jgi:hypothetical protein